MSWRGKAQASTSEQSDSDSPFYREVRSTLVQPQGLEGAEEEANRAACPSMPLVKGMTWRRPEHEPTDDRYRRLEEEIRAKDANMDAIAAQMDTLMA